MPGAFSQIVNTLLQRRRLDPELEGISAVERNLSDKKGFSKEHPGLLCGRNS